MVVDRPRPARPGTDLVKVSQALSRDRAFGVALEPFEKAGLGRLEADWR